MLNAPNVLGIREEKKDKNRSENRTLKIADYLWEDQENLFGNILQEMAIKFQEEERRLRCLGRE